MGRRIRMKVQISEESLQTYQLTTHNGVSVEIDDNTIEEIELAFDLFERVQNLLCNAYYNALEQNETTTN